MNLVLHNDTETAFNHNGIGVLIDAFSTKVKEVINGTYELDFSYPINGLHADKIADRCIVMAKPNHSDDPQPFRICQIKKESNFTIKVYAQHISYDTVGIPVSPFSALGVEDAFIAMKNAVVGSCPFDFYTDKSSYGTMNSAIPKSVRKLLGGSEGSFLDLYGGEYEFDKYFVKLLSRRGADRGVSIRYGKNLSTVEQDRNCASVYTGIYPYWVSNEGELVQLSEKVLYADGTYNYTKILDLDFSGEFQEAPTESELRERANRYMSDNKIGVPQISLKVKFIPLEKTEEYKDIAVLERVSMGDTVSVWFPLMSINASARVVETEYDPILEKYNSVTLGNVKSSIADTIRKQSNDIENQKAELNRKPSTYEVSGMISNGLGNILGISGGTVRILDTNSDGMLDEIYIADNPNPAQAIKVWRFNYMGWAASENGYNGPFQMGATLESGLLAEFVTACKLVAGTIQSKDGNTFFLDLDNGTLRINAQVMSVDGSPVSTKDDVDAIQIGGRNLIRNSMTLIYDSYSFESQIPGGILGKSVLGNFVLGGVS